MKIALGMHWDGLAPAAGAALAESRVGPLGMLQLLESRLGLSRPRPRQVERLVAAREALGLLFASGEPHGAASFERDPLAVAGLFLRQRDELMLAGWNGESVLAGSRRLAALSEFSNRLSEVGRQGEGDRLAAILAALERRPLDWESVTVAESEDQVPLAWRRVLNALGAVYGSASLEPVDDAVEGSDLAGFRKAVLAGEKEIESRRDGSLEILSAHSEWTLAQALESLAGDDQSILVVGGRRSELIDRALLRANRSAVGVKAASRARSIPQVLGLALRLRWKPLDPQHLLEFLVHPESPVTGMLRFRLSDALLQSPGIGGKDWRRAVEWSKEKAREKHADNPEEEKRLLERMDKDLEDWIEIERFDLNGRAPAAALAETCSRVAAWASGQLGRFEEDGDSRAVLFRALAGDASQLAKILESAGDISQPELDRLLEETLGNGVATDAPQPELGHVRFVGAPAAVDETADIVLWWNTVEPPDPAVTQWTDSERVALAERGMELPDVTALLEAESAAWLRPLLAARKKLIMFLPRQQAGEPLPQHPLISRLRALLGEAPLPRRDLDREFEVDAPPAGMDTTELEPVILPARRRWWRLPADIDLPGRGKESFSSLEKFIYSPYRWVLEYAARIRPGKLGTEQLECGPRLYGTLIHRLVEDLFNEDPPVGLDWRDADANSVERWVRERWEALLELEGMPLLAPGRQSERAGVLADAVNSIRDLVGMCQRWGVAEAVADHTPEAAPFQGGLLTGDIDLLLTGANGQQAVVDLKYGGRSGKERQLKEGRPLQLAVYSYLLSGEGRPVSPAAFYILSNQRLLTADTGFFGSASTIAPASGHADLGEVWAEFEEVWRWRRRQLDEGVIEVTVSGAEPDAASEPPLPNWSPPKDADNYSDHTTLTGF